MAHSPLGGSVAARFIACPGSVGLITRLPIEVVSTDPLQEEWREVGTAAHALAAKALWTEKDAWELSGENFGWPLNADDLVAIQTYLEYVRSVRTFNQFIEEEVGNSELHEHLHGTLDWSQYQESDNFMEVVDYKHGAGVIVEVEENLQIMYYVFCKISKWNARPSMRIRLTIVQPRAFHKDGPIRSWDTTAEYILNWGYKVLLPAMLNTEISDELNPGKHCQFCPAMKVLACPAALAWFDEATEETPMNITDQQLAERFARISVVMFVKKAIEQEVLKRTLEGHKLDDVKLVQQKANRVWKDGSKVVFQDNKDAWTEPSLKSPAEMEKIAGLKDLVKSWAYTPNTGYVAVPTSDRRREVSLPSAADAFQQYITTGE